MQVQNQSETIILVLKSRLGSRDIALSHPEFGG